MKRLLILGLIMILFIMGVGCNSQENALDNSRNITTENNKKSNEELNNDSKEDVQANEETKEETKEESKEESKEEIAIYKDVSTAEAKKLMENIEDLVVLDVRTEAVYNVGHLKNAINISHELVEERLSEIEQYKNTPILVYCRTGRRSGIVIDILKKNDFNLVYHMHEGISKWPYDVEK